MEFKIDFSKLEKKSLKQSYKAVLNATSNTYIDIKKYSPIDTGTYLKGNKNMGVSQNGNRIIGVVQNLGDYVERVESGFKKKAVNWHLKNIGQIYNSKGADVYGKAIAKNKDKFLKDLRG